MLLWILIAIALFAALSYTFTQGFRSGEQNIGREKRKLIAGEIVEYARSVKQAVRLLQINGCDDTEISFDQSAIAGYTNASAPSDKSCHVFNPNGGGLTIVASPVPGTTAATAYVGENKILYNADDLNTSAADLLLITRNIENIGNDVCASINDLLGVDNPGDLPPDEGSGFDQTTAFDGNYGDGTTILNMPAGPTHQAACVRWGTSHIFFHVLIPR